MERQRGEGGGGKGEVRMPFLSTQSVSLTHSTSTMVQQRQTETKPVALSSSMHCYEPTNPRAKAFDGGENSGGGSDEKRGEHRYQRDRIVVANVLNGSSSSFPWRRAPRYQFSSHLYAFRRFPISILYL